MLQLTGNDVVTLQYKSRYVGGGAEMKTLTATVASDARVVIRNPEGDEVRGVVVGDQMIVEVNDPSRDIAGQKSTVTVDLKTKKARCGDADPYRDGRAQRHFPRQHQSAARRPHAG